MTQDPVQWWQPGVHEGRRAGLLARGVDAAMLRATGFGAAQPIADNATEDGRAKNRRVELVLQ